MADKVVGDVHKVFIKKRGEMYPMGSYAKRDIGEIVDKIINGGGYSGKEVVVHRIITHEVEVRPFKGIDRTE